MNHKIVTMDYELNLERRANKLQRSLKYSKNSQIKKLLDEYFDLITNKMSNNSYDRNCGKELVILNKMKLIAQDESAISEKIIEKFIRENFRETNDDFQQLENNHIVKLLEELKDRREYDSCTNYKEPTDREIFDTRTNYQVPYDRRTYDTRLNFVIPTDRRSHDTHSDYQVSTNRRSHDTRSDYQVPTDRRFHDTRSNYQVPTDIKSQQRGNLELNIEERVFELLHKEQLEKGKINEREIRERIHKELNEARKREEEKKFNNNIRKRFDEKQIREPYHHYNKETKYEDNYYNKEEKRKEYNYDDKFDERKKYRNEDKKEEDRYARDNRYYDNDRKDIRKNEINRNQSRYNSNYQRDSKERNEDRYKEHEKFKRYNEYDEYNKGKKSRYSDNKPQYGNKLFSGSWGKDNKTIHSKKFVDHWGDETNQEKPEIIRTKGINNMDEQEKMTVSSIIVMLLRLFEDGKKDKEIETKLSGFENLKFEIEGREIITDLILNNSNVNGKATSKDISLSFKNIKDFENIISIRFGEYYDKKSLSIMFFNKEDTSDNFLNSKLLAQIIKTILMPTGQLFTFQIKDKELKIICPNNKEFDCKNGLLIRLQNKYISIKHTHLKEEAEKNKFEISLEEDWNTMYLRSNEAANKIHPILKPTASKNKPELKINELIPSMRDEEDDHTIAFTINNIMKLKHIWIDKEDIDNFNDDKLYNVITIVDNTEMGNEREKYSERQWQYAKTRNQLGIFERLCKTNVCLKSSLNEEEMKMLIGIKKHCITVIESSIILLNSLYNDFTPNDEKITNLIDNEKKSLEEIIKKDNNVNESNTTEANTKKLKILTPISKNLQDIPLKINDIAEELINAVFKTQIKFKQNQNKIRNDMLDYIKHIITKNNIVININTKSFNYKDINNLSNKYKKEAESQIQYDVLISHHWFDFKGDSKKSIREYMKELIKLMFNHSETNDKNKISKNEQKLFELIINTLKEYNLDFIGGNDVMEDYFIKLKENNKEQAKGNKIAKSTENRINNKNKLQVESSDDELEGVTRFRKFNKNLNNMNDNVENIEEFPNTGEDNSEEEEESNNEEDVTEDNEEIENSEEVKIHTDNENEINDEDIEVPPSIPPIEKPRIKFTQLKQINDEITITEFSKKYKKIKVEKLWKVYKRVSSKQGFINVLQRVLINNDKLAYDTIIELINQL